MPGLDMGKRWVHEVKKGRYRAVPTKPFSFPAKALVTILYLPLFPFWKANNFTQVKNVHKNKYLSLIKSIHDWNNLYQLPHTWSREGHVPRCKLQNVAGATIEATWWGQGMDLVRHHFGGRVMKALLRVQMHYHCHYKKIDEPFWMFLGILVKLAKWKL